MTYRPRWVRELRRRFDQDRRQNAQLEMLGHLRAIERMSWDLDLMVTPLHPSWTPTDYGTLVKVLDEVIGVLTETRSAATGALR